MGDPEIINVGLVVLARLRSELEHQIGKENRELWDWTSKQFAILEWALKVKGGYHITTTETLH